MVESVWLTGQNSSTSHNFLSYRIMMFVVTSSDITFLYFNLYIHKNALQGKILPYFSPTKRWISPLFWLRLKLSKLGKGQIILSLYFPALSDILVKTLKSVPPSTLRKIVDRRLVPVISFKPLIQPTFMLADKHP